MKSQIGLACRWPSFLTDIISASPPEGYCPVWGCLEFQNVVPRGFGREPKNLFDFVGPLLLTRDEIILAGIKLSNSYYDIIRFSSYPTWLVQMIISRRIGLDRIRDIFLGWDDNFRENYETGQPICITFVDDKSEEKDVYLCVPRAPTSIGRVLWKRDFAGLTLQELVKMPPYYYSEAYYSDNYFTAILFKVLEKEADLNLKS